MTDLSIHLDPADIDADSPTPSTSAGSSPWRVGASVPVERPSCPRPRLLRRVERECEKRRHQFRRDGEAA
jgi:hypothetical protein